MDTVLIISFKAPICLLSGLNYLVNQLSLKNIGKIEGTLAYDFIRNVPYRVKECRKLTKYIKSDYKDSILNELKLRIEDIVSKYSDKFSTIPDNGICY